MCKWKREYDFIVTAYYDHVLDQSEKTKQMIHVILVLRRRRGSQQYCETVEKRGQTNHKTFFSHFIKSLPSL